MPGGCARPRPTAIWIGMRPDTPVYLDHSATTPVDPAVVAVMLPWWTTDFGNPSSVHHFGRRAKHALEEARTAIAVSLGAHSEEIHFTASGSESDNLALRGVMWAAHAAGRGNHLITSAIEHKAILDTARQLEQDWGFAVTVLPVDRAGRVAVADVEAAIRPGQTVLISIMAANNEIGTLQPIEAIGALAHAHGVLFHTDAVQAAGQLGWDMRSQPIDLLSLAPHKFYGPKGMGILYVRQDVPLYPVLTGGGQENGRRPGTENVAFAVGAAKALELAQARRAADLAHYQSLRDALITAVLAGCPDDCILTGHPTHRLAHHASFAVRHVSGNDLLMHLDLGGIAASSGSACTVGNPKPSPTLEALGLDESWTRGGIRFSFGRSNTLNDAERAADLLLKAIVQLRHYVGRYA